MSSLPLKLTVNGVPYELTVEPNRTLLEVVRDRLRLTGSKEGCGTGDCGACSVILDGQIVTSCLVLALEADGRDVLTVEGLVRDGQLHPVQKAFVEYGAVQCGFCTPGMIMAAKALLDTNPNPTREEIKRAIAGNLCRCTGYARIIEAVEAAARGHV